MTIADFLRQTTLQFEKAGVNSARLDAQVLLERTLKQNKAWLLAHGDEVIDDDKLTLLHEQVARRASREPLAYILGFQEFYGRRFAVGEHVLIPRPATEELIEQLKALPLPDHAALLDVGTGSGAIAITAAIELPQLRVQACDISKDALEIAEKNAERLGAQNITFFESDLLAAAHQHYDVIAANLPYVARGWQRSPETEYEPVQALFAEQDGLELITKLIAQAPAKMNKNGFLLLEADPRQHQTLIHLAKDSGFKNIHTTDFCLSFRIRTSD